VAARKFIFNAGVLTSAFSFLGLARTTRRGPRDWRLVLMWVSALVGLALAVGSVIEESRDAEDY
jgi:cytochrome c oxidase assembly factor CtaG